MISLYDPDSMQFASVDTGQQAQATLLLNILIELRVQNMYLQAQNLGVIGSDLDQLRMDVVGGVSPSAGQTLINTNAN